MDARLSAKPIFKHREWAELIKPCLGNDGQDRQTVSTPKPPPVDPGPANNRIADHNDTQPADNHDHYGKVDDQNEVGEQGKWHYPILSIAASIAYQPRFSSKWPVQPANAKRHSMPAK
ncbi:MAG: hypothetical protein RL458_305 [Pseudomonadota bacterium]